MSTGDRKADHLALTADGRSAYQKSTGFEAYDFVHDALPEMGLADVDTSVNLMGRIFPAPVFVSSMTGGLEEGRRVNGSIARFCQRNGLPFGVGSMRAMLERPELADTFSVVREEAPGAFVAANIGGAQLVGLEAAQVRHLIDVVAADAVIVHLNPLQELMQAEGDRDFVGITDAIRRLVETGGVPVIVKETGAGISGLAAKRLHECGVRVVDVAGAGGTSWSKVENRRKEEVKPHERLFDEWGLPTAHCLIDIKTQYLPGLEVIASGGIRTAHDVAKSLCMGAKTCGFAGSLIGIILREGEEGLQAWYDDLLLGLKMTMCLLGAKSAGDLGMQMLRRV